MDGIRLRFSRLHLLKGTTVKYTAQISAEDSARLPDGLAKSYEFETEAQDPRTEFANRLTRECGYYAQAVVENDIEVAVDIGEINEIVYIVLPD